MNDRLSLVSASSRCKPLYSVTKLNALKMLVPVKRLFRERNSAFHFCLDHLLDAAEEPSRSRDLDDCLGDSVIAQLTQKDNVFFF